MNTEAPVEIVILNDYASLTGGSTAVAMASALGLAARGVPVTFFTCVGPIAPQLIDVPNLTVICLGQEEIAKDGNRVRAFIDGWRNERAVRALRLLLKDKSPARTLVHVHTWTKALSPFALHEVAALGFPLVVTLHDFFITCPNGGFFEHGVDQICHRTPLSGACWTCNCDRRNFGHKLWRNARTVLQNKMLNVPAKVARFVGVSEFSLKIMQPYLPPGVATTFVRNPVDCVAAPPVAAAKNREFVFVGRFEAEKGVKLFADAVRRSGVSATFIGDGALMPTVRELCPNARFTGWLKPAEIRSELSRARALVFPPLWYETLGLVVIEGAAAGVPVIVASNCAATDNIRDNVNGLHFAHGSAEALAATMLRLAADDALASRLSEAAHAWYWNAPWTTERHVDELVNVYEQIVGPVTRTPAREGVFA